MTSTTIKVSAETHERLRRAAQAAHVTQGAFIAAMLEAQEEREFWTAIEAMDPAETRRALAEDGDLPGADYRLEDELLDAPPTDGTAR